MQNVGNVRNFASYGIQQFIFIRESNPSREITVKSFLTISAITDDPTITELSRDIFLRDRCTVFLEKPLDIRDAIIILRECICELCYI